MIKNKQFKGNIGNILAYFVRPITKDIHYFPLINTNKKFVNNDKKEIKDSKQDTIRNDLPKFNK